MEFKDGVATAKLFVAELKDMQDAVNALCEDVSELRSEYSLSCRDAEVETCAEVDYRFCNVLSNCDHLCELAEIEKHRRPHWKDRAMDFQFALSREIHDFAGRIYKVLQEVQVNGFFKNETEDDIEDYILRRFDEWRVDTMESISSAMEFFSETLTYDQFTEYMDNVENESKIFFPDMK